MKFGVSVWVVVVGCCLASVSASWLRRGWSLEAPENCPHRNNDTNECSTIRSSNYTCMSIKCCGEDSSTSEDSDEDDDSFCEHGICVHLFYCTVYRCRTRCCDGYERDHYGRCRNETGELECQNNGIRRRSYGFYYCDCPRGFAGRSCEIPICHCENMGECTVRDEQPYCECMPGYSGTYCENVVCDLQCENGGSCMSDGHQQICKCPHGYVGEFCETEYVNSELCPLPEVYIGGHMDDIRTECQSDDDCHGNNNLCCNEGSNLICRPPATGCFDHNDEYVPIGAHWSPDPCTSCECTHESGIECYMMSCAIPVCEDGQDPIHNTTQCCPSCPPPILCTDDAGNRYSVGDTWNLDPCTTCHCLSGGESACSAIRCSLPTCDDNQILISKDTNVCCPYCKNTDCEHNGDIYPDGATFKDDCNTCSCSNGNVLCTLMACPTTTSSPTSCVHKDVVYADGISFNDDCNTCTCNDGRVACTEMACPPTKCITDAGEEYEDGESFKIECNTCTCQNGHLACTAMQCVTEGPVCHYNGTVYSSGASFNIDCNQCFCTSGKIACTKKACPCYNLACQNGGKCYITNGVHSCHCPPMYAGNLCDIKLDNPDVCPKPQPWTTNVTSNCRLECKSNADCKYGEVCCKEGCHLFCRPSTKVVCNYEGRVYQIGETFSPSPCERCTCEKGGHMACAVTACAWPDCPYGQMPIQKPDKCCPECPTSPIPPKISCPKEKVVIRAPAANAQRFLLTREMAMVKAIDSDGNIPKVRFDPPYAEHCKCYDSDKAVKWAVASVTHNGITEQCKVAYVVKDVNSPVFKSCPEDMYIFEDEEITYKKPNYTDNVAIAGKQCNMDPLPRKYKPGAYSFSYAIWDFDRNSATCNFKLSVSTRDASFDDLPQGLKNRSTDSSKVAVIAAPIAGLLAIVIAVVLLVLCCRHRRANTGNASPARASRGPYPAYDNNIYAVPSDVSVPTYPSLPPNPPAYHSDNISIKSDYTFLPPPAYKEVAELKAPSSYTNPDYASIRSGSVKSSSSKMSVKM